MLLKAAVRAARQRCSIARMQALLTVHCVGWVHRPACPLFCLRHVWCEWACCRPWASMGVGGLLGFLTRLVSPVQCTSSKVITPTFSSRVSQANATCHSGFSVRDHSPGWCCSLIALEQLIFAPSWQLDFTLKTTLEMRLLAVKFKFKLRVSEHSQIWSFELNVLLVKLATKRCSWFELQKVRKREENWIQPVFLAKEECLMNTSEPYCRGPLLYS